MKSIKCWIKILACLSALALFSTACQVIAPAGPTATATSAATETPSATDTPYPQPYPLLPTFDPYQAPALVDPYAYPAQGVAPAPGTAEILYPGVQDGTEVYWVQAVAMMFNGEVTQVMQTHDLKVYLTLKDGRTLFAIEPQIDEVLKAIQSCGDLCKNILVATE
jgi:hypothetical protein